jgi:hypothetical protein
MRANLKRAGRAKHSRRSEPDALAGARPVFLTGGAVFRQRSPEMQDQPFGSLRVYVGGGF